MLGLPAATSHSRSFDHRFRVRAPVIIPPAAYDRVYHLDHVPQPHRRSSRQVADLILEPRHRRFARHGVDVETKNSSAAVSDTEALLYFFEVEKPRLIRRSRHAAWTQRVALLG